MDDPKKNSTYFQRTLGPGFQEDLVWTHDIKPLLSGVPDNVMSICAFGCAEILNNANDHSESTEVAVTVAVDDHQVVIEVLDAGIGIFRKIQQVCGLDDQRHAVFELTKGKLTTDPERHTGEGIFFTSRMFDVFSILSGDLYLSHTSSRDWLVSAHNAQSGTFVAMTISRTASTTTKEVFDRYAVDQDDFGFKKTRVAIILSNEGDALISRSQGRRIVARLEAFKEVLLDFEGIKSVSPAFADEIFRVFHGQHPDLTILVINDNDDVKRMIAKARAAASEER